MKNEAYKKLTDTFKKEFAEKIASKDFADSIASIKDATGDSGTFKVIVSTADRDRQGESVIQSGWDLSFYKLNPVVLWAHDYGSMPIGVCTSIEVVDGKLQAEGKFAPTAFAQDVRKLYDLGMMRTTSVGFIPKEFDPNNDEIITRAELLEFSFVPVPANPYALSLSQAKELGIDMEMLKTKGMTFEVKADEPAAVPAEPVAPAAEAAPADSAEPVDPVAPEAAAPAAEAKDSQTPTADEVRMRSAISEVLNHLTAACTALKDFAGSEGGKGVSTDDADNGTKGSKTSSGDSGEVTEFLRTRDLVRTASIALGKVLRDYNRADRYRGK